MYKYWKAKDRFKNKSEELCNGWFLILNTGRNDNKDYYKCLSINNWTNSNLDVYFDSTVGREWNDKEPPEYIKKWFDSLKVAHL